MPCFKYVPKRSVIPAHRAFLARQQTVELCSTDVIQFNDNYVRTGTSQTTLEGRTKTIKLTEILCVDITITNIDVTQRPQWMEFFRSVSCGERFTADLCDVPGFVHPIDIQRAFMQPDQDEAWNRVTPHHFSVGFSLCFDEVRVL